MIDKSLAGYWSRGLGMVWKIAMSDFWILVDYCWALRVNAQVQTSTQVTIFLIFLCVLHTSTARKSVNFGKCDIISG